MFVGMGLRENVRCHDHRDAELLQRKREQVIQRAAHLLSISEEEDPVQFSAVGRSTDRQMRSKETGKMLLRDDVGAAQHIPPVKDVETRHFDKVTLSHEGPHAEDAVAYRHYCSCCSVSFGRGLKRQHFEVLLVCVHSAQQRQAQVAPSSLKGGTE